MADYIGTDLKFLVEPSAAGFVKTRDEFEVVITRGSVEKKFYKSELAVDEQDNYYVCFSSEEFGAGQYYITIITHTPDEDFDDGFREDVKQYPLVNIQKTKK